MKKFSNNISLVALVLGALMILFGLTFIDKGRAATVIGIFGLLLGICYIFAAVLTILGLSNPAVDMTKECIYLIAFPLFMFVYYLCMLIVAYNTFTYTNWILVILLLIATLATATLGIISIINKNDSIKKITSLSVLAFIGLFIILLVFPVGAGIATIADLSLIEVLFIACYFLVSKQFTELPTL